MAEMYTSYKGLPVANNRIEGLMADFSGLNNLESVVYKALKRLEASDKVQNQVAAVKNRNLSMNEFDGWFAELIRKELGRTLGIVRNQAIKRARTAGGLTNSETATAILRRQYRDEYAGNINIAGNRKRISWKKRTYEPGTKKKRYVSSRTKKLNEYFGPDRSFILRFLQFGTDTRTANTYGPKGKGSLASWGNRGSVGGRDFFGPVSTDMQAAARELGTTLVNYVENWIEKVFNENE